VTGRLTGRIVDLSRQGCCSAISFVRSYRGGRDSSGELGIGWIHSLERHVVLVTGVGAAEIDSGGEFRIFRSNASGGFEPTEIDHV